MIVHRVRLTGLFRIAVLAAFAKTSCTSPSTSPASQLTATAQLSHVVLIVADDQGWGDLSVHGNTNLHTPNLDGLAASGVSFENFYVSAVCSPTRAELLSGQHALSVGVTGTGAGRERLDLGVPILPEFLAEAGYRTGLFGKWHNGSQGDYHPLRRGFDEFYGFTSGHWGSYVDYLIESADSLTSFEGYLPDVLTDQAIEWMTRDATGAPTFTILTYPTPHSPMMVPDRWWNEVATRQLDSLGTEVENDTFTRAAIAMVENLDWNVGRLLAAIDSVGQGEETLVIYLTDNGPNSARWNGGMRGRKGSVDEGGVRSPMFWRQPNRLPAGHVIEANVSVRDVMPTLLEYLGIAAPSVEASEATGAASMSVASLLYPEVKGNHSLVAALAQRPLINQWRQDVSVRQGEYRLDADGRLYHIAKDRGQRREVTQEHEQLAESMQLAAAAFREDYDVDGAQEDTRPFTLANEGLATLLPARDASAVGEPVRSSRWPNDSYFRGWSDTASYLRWPVQVTAAGRYEVTLYYALDAGGVGTKLTLSQGNAEIEYQLSEAQPREDRGADRVQRDESYVRDWAKVELGSLPLTVGTDTLRLRVADVPRNATGPAVWSLALRMVDAD